MERDLLQTGDHQPLTRLDSMHERRGIEQRLGCACVQPRRATAEFLRAQCTLVEIAAGEFENLGLPTL